MHYCNISISLKNEDGSCPPQCLDYYKLICWLSQTGFMDYGLKLSFVVLGFPQFQSSFSEAVGNSNKQSYASSIRQKQKTPMSHATWEPNALHLKSRHNHFFKPLYAA